MTSIFTEKHFINRELSWIAFNERVLYQAGRDDLPILERLKFSAIFSSNLEEFYMIRVAGLKQQIASSVRKKDLSGLTPSQQLVEISDKIQELNTNHCKILNQIIKHLSTEGIRILDISGCDEAQIESAMSFFHSDIKPAVTVLTIPSDRELPWLPGGQLNVILKVKPLNEESAFADKDGLSYVIIPLLSAIPRFIPLTNTVNERILIPQEQIILANAQELLPDFEILSGGYFKLTRDADVDIQDDEAADLLATVEQAVRSRRRRSPIRLEVSDDLDYEIVDWLHESLELTELDTFRISSLIGANEAMSICFCIGFDHLKIPDWPPQPALGLADSTDIFATLQERDILLSHPYESFQPVVDLINKAADDPCVLAIKQTLYRTSGDSPIIRALERAAESGKQVTVVVELKARFDEQQNIKWARRLEDAGCFVVYGVAKYKIHSKALLIVRKEAGRLRQYVHLATGNYHDKTAKIYADLGLMTSNKDIAVDVSAFFNLVTGLSEPVRWKKIAVAPITLKSRLIELIDREIMLAEKGESGTIIAKMNSLQDRQMIEALYSASQAGVKIKLNIRGICCLKPGLKGVSENIKVISIVDRFLEHARIFCFGNGGRSEYYLSSADWMTRNLDKRLEILFPVEGQWQQTRLKAMLDIYFKDKQTAWKLNSDGTWTLPAGKGVRAQKELYDEVSKSLANRKVQKIVPFQSPGKE